MRDQKSKNPVTKIRFWAKAQSDIFYAFLLVLALFVVGTTGFSILERWSLLNSLYATIITVTTIGYGDFVPVSAAGRIFSIFFATFAVGIVGYTVTAFAAVVIKREGARIQYKIQERKMKQLAGLQDHIILCGGGIIGRQVAREFYRAGTPFVVIEEDEYKLRQTVLYMHEDYISKKYRQLYNLDYSPDTDTDYEHETLSTLADELGVLYLQEDATADKSLIKAGIGQARSLVTTFNNDKENLFVVLSARQLSRKFNNSDLLIVCRVMDDNNRSKFKAAGADRLHSLNLAGSVQLANSILQPEVSDFVQHMFFHTDQSIRFSAIYLDDHSMLAGKNVHAARKETNKSVIAVKRNDEYFYMPELDTRLESGDILIVVGASVIGR